VTTYRRQFVLFQLQGKVLVMKKKFSFLFLRRRKFADEGLFLQSMLLSKALQMQQDLEDKKNEIIIEVL
jgi:hypothetical protein